MYAILLKILIINTMVDNVIIKDLKETEASYFIIGDNGKEYEIRKKDLGVVNLAVDNQVDVIRHPGFPSVVAGLNLLGHRVFHKTREEIIDEWMENMEISMIKSLPSGARHLLAMFEMFTHDFKAYRLAEVTALKLGIELNEKIKADQLINNFVGLPRKFQLMVLPGIDNPLLPSVPMERVVEIAKAFAADNARKVDCNDLSQLKGSAVMNLVNATVDRYGKFCQPRSEYIAKYVEALSC